MATSHIGARVIAKIAATRLSSSIRKQAVGDRIEERTEGAELIADTINSSKS